MSAPDVDMDRTWKGAMDDDVIRLRDQIDQLRQERARLKSLIGATAAASSLPGGPGTVSNARQGRTAVAAGRAAGDVKRPTREGIKANSGYQQHSGYHQHSLYRMGAGATMFEVRDPDPSAVDRGRVLGVRIEVCIKGKFLTPYYLLLVRPAPPALRLAIHKHTIPAALPLPALVAHYLPQTAAKTAMDPGAGVAPPPSQDLPGLVRALRRELTSYHLRIAFVESMHQEAKAAPGAPGLGDAVDAVDAVDAEGRDLRVHWADGRTARIRIGTVGDVRGGVVMRQDERDRDAERMLVGGDGRLEGLWERLEEVGRGGA
ncbi:MAG: hypothetical protein M1826_007357 [Phylliscum demangeonii]|nr:MAG: hypothetical protein M1826_007357 [Phylliscum demangeonii]